MNQRKVYERMKEERTNDIDGMRDYEDIRQVPLEPGRPASGRQNPPVGDSYIGGRPRRERVSRRKPGMGDTGPGAGKPVAGTAQEDQNTRKKTERSQRNKKTGNSGSGERRNRSGKGVSFLTLLLVLVLGAGAGLGGGYYLWGWERPYTVDLKAVEVPDYVEQDFIRKNIFSRPDVGRQKVDKIVIHYVANPGSTARNNRDYFDSLADQDPQKSGSSASSHFVVGLEGEVIQCIPVNEIAYANAPLNNTTVAIEVCHPDDSGKFNDATYESLVDLTAFLCRQLKLTPGDVIRHYDVNEKLCPKYYVEHEDAWERFQKDVKAAMKTESAG
ncbi:MAG: peptidoglycan recognition protein family protein [Enterocloster clostridioformis]|nr:peptidoglycan recognition family protein [Enterocloster clostridioformis]MCI6124550.1 peptidoglycan recognition protein family protein [Enterocloster clostridioformis]